MKAAPFPLMFPRSPGGFGWGNTKDADNIYMFPRSPVFPRIFIGGGVKTRKSRYGKGG
jgi:hypothetical protein